MKKEAKREASNATFQGIVKALTGLKVKEFTTPQGTIERRFEGELRLNETKSGNLSLNPTLRIQNVFQGARKLAVGLGEIITVESWLERVKSAKSFRDLFSAKATDAQINRKAIALNQMLRRSFGVEKDVEFSNKQLIAVVKAMGDAVGRLYNKYVQPVAKAVKVVKAAAAKNAAVANAKTAIKSAKATVSAAADAVIKPKTAGSLHAAV